jgi:hypothetical protein
VAPGPARWRGRARRPYEICRQTGDPARKRGRKAELIHHIGTDTLVGWAWKPGFGRSPPRHAGEAGALVEAWVRPELRSSS